jgi:hypothetical protein
MSITKIKQLMMFKEIIPVYSEKYGTDKTVCGQNPELLTVKATTTRLSILVSCLPNTNLM